MSTRGELLNPNAKKAWPKDFLRGNSARIVEVPERISLNTIDPISLTIDGGLSAVLEEEW